LDADTPEISTDIFHLEPVIDPADAIPTLFESFFCSTFTSLKVYEAIKEYTGDRRRKFMDWLHITTDYANLLDWLFESEIHVQFEQGRLLELQPLNHHQTVVTVEIHRHAYKVSEKRTNPAVDGHYLDPDTSSLYLFQITRSSTWLVSHDGLVSYIKDLGITAEEAQNSYTIYLVFVIPTILAGFNAQVIQIIARDFLEEEAEHEVWDFLLTLPQYVVRFLEYPEDGRNPVTTD
jgi:hypothetical protein